jgi:hypothetical protein
MMGKGRTILLFTIGFQTWLSGQGTLPDEPHFTPTRGFFDSAFVCTVSWDSAGSSIRYTLDGSDPRTSPSAADQSSPARIDIDPTSEQGRARTPAVTLRAYAHLNGTSLTQVGTHTFIFIEKVMGQTYPGGGWPKSSVNNQVFDWEMDPDVVQDSRYREHMDDALLDIPTYSLVTDLSDWFDPKTGIYVNAMERGEEWERPVSIELIDSRGKEKGFHINGGMRIRGGWSRHPDDPKHAFRLFFRSEYGKNKLEYPLFGSEGVSTFDCLDLRTAQNYSWSYKGSGACVMIRDVFSRDCQRDLGQPYTRSRACHLYLNGMYWGLFQTQERPEADYAESYFGGDAADFDVIKVDSENNMTIEATDGTLDAYNELWKASQSGFASTEAYFKVQGKNADGSNNGIYPVLANVDNLIDFLLVIYYTGNFDSPVTAFGGNRSPNNFYGICDRLGRTGFLFFAHDAEHTLLGPQTSELGYSEYGLNRTGPYPAGSQIRNFNPQWLHQRLSVSAEYQTRFADRVYRHFFNRGALTRDASRRRLAARRDEIDEAIIAESARWGDFKAHPPRNKDDDWAPAVAWISDTFFSDRTEVVLAQLKEKNLYPSLEPPLFYSGSTFRMTNPNANSAGSILYTLDGSDPRAIGGAPSAAAQDVGDEKELAVPNVGVLKARVRDGEAWSAVRETRFGAGQDLRVLKVTEIHYHPLPEGEVDDKELEFIELQNTGSTTLSLSGVRFVEGIEYRFADDASIGPGEYRVLASNSSCFRQRYGFSPYGEYDGQLDNSGERVVLVGASGDTLLSIEYDDHSPWPEEADGAGYSLTIRNPDGSIDSNDPECWAPSKNIHGSPGVDDAVTGVARWKAALPPSFLLEQNYPNPFNPVTDIRFSVPTRSRVTVEIFDALGKKLETLAQSDMPPGKHAVRWNAEGRPSGIYFCRMTTVSFVAVKRMLYLK